MKTIVCALLVVAGVHAVNLQIYGPGSSCNTQPTFSFPFLPNTPDQCLTNYASTGLQSAILNCASATSGSKWSVFAWITQFPILNGNYYCDYAGGDDVPVALNGTGTGCVQIVVDSIPLGSASVDCGAAENTVEANAGNTAVEMGSNDPFALRIAQGTAVGTKYLNLEYAIISETDDLDDDFVGEGPSTDDYGFSIFHYIPTNDAFVQQQVVNSFNIGDSGTPTTQFTGYVGPASQNISAPTTSQALMLNYVATADFTATSYDTTWTGLAGFAGVSNKVCLRGTATKGTSNPTCSSFAVHKGDTKTAFGLYNWNLLDPTNGFRLGYTFNPVGFTTPKIYFNYDSSKDCAYMYDSEDTVVSITVVETSTTAAAFNYTIDVQPQVNNGDNTFTTADTYINIDDNNVCYLYVDVDTSDFTTGPGHWWLYDPVVVNNNNGGSGSSDASIVSVSAAALVAVVAGVLAAL